MYLSKSERKDVMAIYGCENATEKNHYQVGPDTWIYLFENGDKKYLLVSVDYVGDYDFDVFPHLLKFKGYRLEFVLQREIPAKEDSSKEKASNTILFEYKD